MSFFRARTSPEPVHVGQRSLGIWPRPTHIGQGRFTAKPPCPKEITPRPEHSGHTFTDAPGAAPLPWHVPHSSVTSSSTGILPPNAATRNGTSRVVSTDCPCSASFAFPRPPAPPNMELKRSPSPPRPPMSKSNPPAPAPPGPAPPWPGRAPPGDGPRRAPAPLGAPPPNPNAPSRRMSSYCFRFSTSPTTWYASEISLKRSADLGSFWLASGWYRLASRR